MANPGIVGANKAENKITPQAPESMNDAINDILNGAATENTSAEAAAPGAEQSHAPTTPAGDAKSDKTKYEWTDSTTSLIGRINAQRTQNNNAIETSSLGLAMKKFHEQTRIVGYCCRLDSKIDFKRVVTKASDDKTSDRKYEFVLTMTPPSKPDRVIVKFPLDLISQIDTQKSNLTTAMIKEAQDSASAGSEDAYMIKIFPVNKNSHELFDWINSHCSQPYLTEDQALFVPYTKFNSKGEAETRETYQGHSAYASTGDKPGLKVSCVIASKPTAKIQAAGNTTKIDLTREDASELKVTFTHTGRPRWVAPGNYIVDKRFGVIPGAAPTESGQQIALSKLYFRRWFNPDGSETMSQKLKEDKVKFTQAGEITVQNTGNENEFIASVFTDASWWAKARVEHWYDTVTVNGETKKKVLQGSEIQLVERVEKEKSANAKSKSSGWSTTISNRVFPLTADGVAGSEYTWSMAVPDRIKSALGTAAGQLTHELYRKAMSKTSTTSKPSSRVSIDAGYRGLTFAEIEEKYHEVIRSASSATNKFA